MYCFYSFASTIKQHCSSIDMKIISSLTFYAISLSIALILCKPLLLIILVSIVIAYLANPLSNTLHSFGVPRIASVTISILIIASAVIASFIHAMPMLWEQLFKLATKIPDYISATSQQFEVFVKSIEPKYSNIINDSVEQLTNSIAHIATNIPHHVLNSGSMLLNIAYTILISPIIAWHLLIPSNRANIINTLLKIIPQQYHEDCEKLLVELNNIYSGYIRGYISVILIMATYYALSFYLMHLNYSIALGVIAGISITVPYIGPIVSLALVISTSIFQYGNLIHTTLPISAFIMGQIIEGVFLTPYFVGRKVNLNSAITMLSIISWGSILGILGVIIAIPSTTMLIAIFKTLQAIINKHQD